MLLRAETRVDRSTAAIAVERSPRDGVVHLRVPLTWIGVRTYRDPVTGKLSRELRRPEQVWAASHVESLKRLTCTHGHPSERWDGVVLPVMLDARADAGSGPDETGTLRRPPAAGLQVGQVGDAIERVEIEGASLPVAGVAIHGAAAIADIEAGKTQTSLGYGCLVDHTPGTWTDSGGRAWAYDAEHVLDAEDPRVVAAVAEGFDAATLGANHLAVAIARGRGGPMSELLPRHDAGDAWIEDANPPPVRDDLGEPRLFSMVRGADESGVSGTGRVMDGVLWPDGSVATRWRTVTASDGGFDSWTTFHRIHVCAHPDNATTLPFADGGDEPPCLACKARDAVAAARVNGDEDGAPYPPDVRTINLPARVKGLADKVAPLLGSKVAAKSDGLELNLPPEMAGPVADVLMAMAEQIKAMSGELMEADAAIGAQAAELAVAQDAAVKMQADAAEVAPLLADARKAKRDALVSEAAKVAGGKFDVAADLDEAGIKRAAVVQRLGSAFKRADSVDAVDAAFLALSTAGGKDPDDKAGKPAKRLDEVLPPPPPPPTVVVQHVDEQPRKPSGLYLTDDGE